MANLDYAAQLTEIYNKLVAIDSKQSKMALKSEMNTMQTTTMSSLNSIAAQIQNLLYQVSQLELTMSDILTELRSK